MATALVFLCKGQTNDELMVINMKGDNNAVAIGQGVHGVILTGDDGRNRKFDIQPTLGKHLLDISP